MSLFLRWVRVKNTPALKRNRPLHAARVPQTEKAARSNRGDYGPQMDADTRRCRARLDQRALSGSLRPAVCIRVYLLFLQHGAVCEPKLLMQPALLPCQGRSSKMRLNGVSAARRKRLNPACSATFLS
jgi:hypothetical protein